MTMGTRICIMQAGKLVQIGPPLEVYANPVNTFVAGFLGNPPMNLFDATLASERGEIGIRLGDQVIPLPASSQRELAGFTGPDVVFGIRPEDIHSNPDDVKRPSVKVSGQVSGTEMLGAETIVSVQIPGWQTGLTARLSRGHSFIDGQEINLFLDPGAMHLFDRGSGNALTRTETKRRKPVPED
jgi:multiple sugar transport system ATP-binding protein